MSAVDFEVKLNRSFWRWIQGDVEFKASTALAGQSLLKQSNELARNVNLREARVTMRKFASKSAASGSIW
jgi:hypothetical protein